MKKPSVDLLGRPIRARKVNITAEEIVAKYEARIKDYHEKGYKLLARSLEAQLASFKGGSA